MLQNIKSYLREEEYLLSITNGKIHIFNYKKIKDINKNLVEVLVENKIIKIIGNDFILKKLDKKELLVTGEVKTIEFR